MQKLLFTITIIAVLVFISGCDKGIEPLPAPPSGPTGFSGKVTFTGAWPADVTRTHIIVFKNPIERITDFSIQNLAFVVDPITYNSTEFSYSSETNNLLSLTLTAGIYKYIVVAQSKTPTLSLNRNDWIVVGLYYKDGDMSKPEEMTINQGEITTGINITVDFNNLPPQPVGE
jgi:hypothetical protein